MALRRLVLPRFFVIGKRSLRTCPCLMEKMDQEEFQKNTLIKQTRDTKLASKELFEDVKAKNKKTFKGALEIFKNRDIRRRGAVEFIEAARKHMKEFGVEKDLDVYKSLIDIMPKDVYIPENRIQSGFYHYPKQQECLLDVLVQMSEHKVTPDRETGDLILSITGLDSAPMRKYARMRYWHSKFKNISPFPLPLEMPNDGLELAKMAIERITSVDRATKITVYDTETEVESEDKTWIVSGISPFQKEFLSNIPKKTNLYVEGAFRVWLRGSQVTYFTLKGQARPKRPKHSNHNIDDLSQIKIWTHGEIPEGVDEFSNLPESTVHEQEDGTILACCATGTSSKDSLLSWIRLLEKEVPNLKHLQILFTIKQAWSPIKPIRKEELSMQGYNPHNLKD